MGDPIAAVILEQSREIDWLRADRDRLQGELEGEQKVRAMLAEALESTQTWLNEHRRERSEMRARLAAVEALPERFSNRAAADHWGPQGRAVADICARELTEALAHRPPCAVLEPIPPQTADSLEDRTSGLPSLASLEPGDTGSNPEPRLSDTGDVHATTDAAGGMPVAGDSTPAAPGDGGIASAAVVNFSARPNFFIR